MEGHVKGLVRSVEIDQPPEHKPLTRGLHLFTVRLTNGHGRRVRIAEPA